MKHFIIDGNNLIGKIKNIKKLQNKDRQTAREKLAYLIENYFQGKKVKVSLHFDGFQNSVIRIHGVKIIYSEDKTADEKIKTEISASKNPRNVIVITSDNNIKEFARVCSASVILSEEFSAELKKRKEINEEERKIRSIDNVEEFKKIFNVKK